MAESTSATIESPVSRLAIMENSSPVTAIRHRCIECGCGEYLSKPIDNDPLLLCVRRLTYSAPSQ